jgi:hypothetical protein
MWDLISEHASHLVTDEVAADLVTSGQGKDGGAGMAAAKDPLVALTWMR